MLFISYPQDFKVEKVMIISILFLKKLDLSPSHMAESLCFYYKAKTPHTFLYWNEKASPFVASFY